MQSSHVAFPNTSVPPPPVGNRQSRPILGARVDVMQPRSAATVSAAPRVPNGLRITAANALGYMAPTVDASGDAGNLSNVVVALSPNMAEKSLSNGIARLGAPVVHSANGSGDRNMQSVNSMNRSKSSANQSIVTYSVCSVTSRTNSPTSVTSQTPVVALMPTGTGVYSCASSLTMPQNSIASPSSVSVVMPPVTSPPEVSCDACSHTAITPTTPVQYTYSSPHPAAPVWPGPHAGYVPSHGLIPPHAMWTQNSNGMISPSTNLPPFHYSLHQPTHPPNGMAPDMFQTSLMHNMVNTNMGPQHVMHHYQHYNTYPGKGKGGKLTCHNCGGVGHRANVCNEETVDTYQRESILSR